MNFIFGGNTGETQDSIQRKRALAQGLMAGAPRAPQNVGQGIHSAVSQVAAALINRRANQREDAARKEATEAFEGALSGYGMPQEAEPLMAFAPDAVPTGGAPAAPMAGPAAAPAAAVPTAAPGAVPIPTPKPPLADISFALQGKQRPLKPDQQLQNVLQLAVGEVLGEGARVEVYSGKEQPGHQHGSNRHKTGLAGDIRIYDADGRLVRLDEPRAQAVMTAAADKGVKGIGAGPEYMGDAFHMDMVRHEDYGPGQGPVWGSTAKAMRGDLLQAMQEDTTPMDVQTAQAPMQPTQAPVQASMQDPMQSMGQPQRPFGGIDPRLVAAMSNPYLSDGQRAVAGMLVQQQIQSNQPAMSPIEAARLGMDREKLALEREQIQQQRAMDERKFGLQAQRFDLDRQMAEARTQAERDRIGVARDKLDAQIAGKIQTGTTVNVGGAPDVPEYSRLPQGYVYRRGRDGQVLIDEQGIPQIAPISGGPADVEQQAAETATQNKAQNAVKQAKLVREDIDRALEIVQSSPTWTTGLAGQLLSNVGGTAARDLEGLTQTIRSNIGFDRLTQMREESPTGGALGNVTERELKDLQSVVGNLENSQSAEQLTANLERVGEMYDDIMRKFAAYPGANVAPEAPAMPESVNPDAWQSLDDDGKTLLLEIWPTLSEEEKAVWK